MTPGLRAIAVGAGIFCAVGCDKDKPSDKSAATQVAASTIAPTSASSAIAAPKWPAPPAPSSSAAVSASDWVSVPAGEFSFGCDPAPGTHCPEEERPKQKRHLGRFRIQRTEVTQADYQKCIDAGRCTIPTHAFQPKRKPKHAVVGVSWSEARAYCAFIGGRLPSEAEWEKAARGSDGRTYPWGNAKPSCQLAHYTTCKVPRPAVGSHPKGESPFGVLDMAGGVDEWVADTYVARSSGAKASGQRVARGGAHDPWHIRSTARSALAPEFQGEDLGFRCARD